MNVKKIIRIVNAQRMSEGCINIYNNLCTSCVYSIWQDGKILGISTLNCICEGIGRKYSVKTNEDNSVSMCCLKHCDKYKFDDQEALYNNFEEVAYLDEQLEKDIDLKTIQKINNRVKNGDAYKAKNDSINSNQKQIEVESAKLQSLQSKTTSNK